jgi:hypothetical protein
MIITSLLSVAIFFYVHAKDQSCHVNNANANTDIGLNEVGGWGAGGLEPGGLTPTCWAN